MELIKELGFEKLPTRTEFDKNRIEMAKKVDCLSHYNFALDDISDYLTFLQQKPELWMFVPAIQKDGVWVVLEEPPVICADGAPCLNGCTECPAPKDWQNEEWKQHEEALDRVLFKCQEGKVYDDGVAQVIAEDFYIDVSNQWYYYDKFKVFKLSNPRASSKQRNRIKTKIEWQRKEQLSF